MNAAFASDMLLNKKESDIRYIERMNFLSEKYAGMERVMVQKTPGQLCGWHRNQEREYGKRRISGRFKGKQRTCTGRSKKDAGWRSAKPEEIINEHLIAAINEVGELFDKKNISCHS